MINPSKTSLLTKARRLCLKSPLFCVSGITGTDLNQRVRSIMTLQLENLSRTKRLLLIAAIMAAVAIPILFGHISTNLHAQSATATSTAKFDVASIRPTVVTDPHAHNHIWNEPANSNFRAENVTLKFLLRYAYNIPESRFLGGPKWLDSEKFDIEAKSDPTTDEHLSKLPTADARSEKAHMFQALLADRFQLTLHRETRQLPIYALVPTKGKPKIHPSQANGTTFSESNGRIYVQGSDNTVSLLAEQLSKELGRPVLDKTGLAGRYEITLTWTPDQAQPSDTTGPSIFTAIQEQLGLKLEPQKGPVDVFVIDRVEKPSPN